MALAQIGVNDKENEIIAIPKLLELLDLQGSTVTIDAIGCQREIAQQIKDAHANYVLQVKENQPTLHQKVKMLLDEARLEKRVGWKGSQFQETNGGHGRVETRRVWLTTEVKHLGLELLQLWPSIKAMAAVEREREVIGAAQGKSVELHYYILSDGQCTAEQAGRIIRGHWGIENGLHYVLDVSFNEDQSARPQGPRRGEPLAPAAADGQPAASESRQAEHSDAAQMLRLVIGILVADAAAWLGALIRLHAEALRRSPAQTRVRGFSPLQIPNPKSKIPNLPVSPLSDPICLISRSRLRLRSTFTHSSHFADPS